MRWGIAIVALLGLAAALVALLLSDSQSPENASAPVADQVAHPDDNTDEQAASDAVDRAGRTDASPPPADADESKDSPTEESTAKAEDEGVDASTSEADSAEEIERVNVLLGIQPLRPRMPRAEFESHFPDFEAQEIRINGSEFREGGIIEVGDGIELQIAFDDQDHVAYIISDDPRLELMGGVHVGMRYETLKKKFGDNLPYRIPDYGRFISVMPLQWAVFDDKEGRLEDDDVVQRIELREDMTY